jgi:seryl-tRNA synthetase
MMYGKFKVLEIKMEMGIDIPLKACMDFSSSLKCQKVVKSINVSILMSHATGITQQYYKPKEEELLEDYLKASDLLTINSDILVLNKQLLELEEKNKENEYIIKGKIQEKDEQIKSLSDQFSSMKNELNELVKGLSVVDESGKQVIAMQLIENGVFK